MSSYQIIFDVLVLVWLVGLTFTKGRKGERGHTGPKGATGDKGDTLYLEVKSDK